MVNQPGYNTLQLTGLGTGLSADNVLTIDGSGVVRYIPSSTFSTPGSNWLLTGNTGTTAGTNFIGTNDAVDFVTKTNTIERLRVASSGNVGINIASPIAKLDIRTSTSDITNGITNSVTVNNTAASVTGIANSINFNSGSTVSTTVAATAVSANINGTPGQSYGSLTGIFARIAMNGASSATSAYGINIGSPGGSAVITSLIGMNIRDQLGGASNYNLSLGPSGVPADAGSFSIYNSSARTNYFAGNLGIGTVAPGSALDVKGTIRLSGATSGYVGLAPAAAAGSTTYTLPAADGTAGYQLATNGAGVLSWTDARGATTVSNASTTNTLTTTVNGVTGTGVNIINTNALSLTGSNLTSTINGVASTALDISPAVKANAWALVGNSGTTAGTNFVGTIDAVDFVTKTNNTERLRVVSTGNVGIGTTAPGSALDVKGTIRLSGSTSGFVGLAPAAAAGGTTYTLPTADGTNGQVLSTNGSGTLSWATASGGGSGWLLTGNSGTTTGINFVGTTDGQGLTFKVNSVTAGFLGLSGSSLAASYGVGSSAGFKSTAIGAGATATANNEAVALGYNAVGGSFQGIAIGSGATANSANNNEIAIGYNANSNSYQGIAIGTSASTSTANGAIALGVSASTTSINSVSVGTSAFVDKTSDNSISIGNTATVNTSSTNVIAIGSGAAIGKSSDYSTALGYKASVGASATNNTAIGSNASVSGAVSNGTALGNGASVTASNSISVGNTSVTSIKGQVAFGTYSDGRFKKNIKANVPGLDFIVKLRPVTYNWNIHKFNAHLAGKDYKLYTASLTSDSREEEAIRNKERILYTGFIAQEVEQAALATHYNFSGVVRPQNNRDAYSLNYADFVVLLVKAAQELNKKNEELNNKLDEQQKMIDLLMKEMLELKNKIK